MKPPLFRAALPCAALLSLAPAGAQTAQDAALTRVLNDGATTTTAFPTDRFAPPSDAIAPARQVQGELTIQSARAGHFTLRKDAYSSFPAMPDLALLPAARITLIQVGDDVVPVQRGPIAGDHPAWEWIFEPGRAWSMADRPGVTYVALPFALMERNANCLHNGLALFTLDADGRASHLVYQIGSETCSYLQFDLWGATDAAFAAGPVADAEATAAAYRRELAERRPVRPVSDLGSGAARNFGSPQEVDPAAMTTFGYSSGGALYAGPCPTRYGPYPYCDVLDLPSYSWAKSIVASIAAMRLEFLFPGAMDSLISDYVPQCDADRWRGVTFRNALDMATGLYNAPEHEADENSRAMTRFFLSESHADKIAIACTAFERREAPGQRFVYHTSDTYILGTAMAAYLRRRIHGDVDLYDDMLVPIWRALGLSPVVMQTRRTRDAVRQPFTGWGLVLHRNDVVLLTDFLQRGGTVGGQPLLDRDMLNQAMQRDPRHRGLRAIVDTQRYQHGFWAWNAGPVLNCARDVWIPAMSGFGGLAAAMMPNGSTYFYFSDGGDFLWRKAAEMSNRLSPICENAL